MARAETTAPPVAKPLSKSDPGGPATSRGAWMALAAALLGWMFDGAEMGIFSMVGRPAVKDLLSDYLATLPADQQEGVSACGSVSSLPAFSSARRPAACSSAGWAIASAACGR